MAELEEIKLTGGEEAGEEVNSLPWLVIGSQRQIIIIIFMFTSFGMVDNHVGRI